MPVARIDINRIDVAVVLSLLFHGLIAALPPIAQKPGEKALAPPAPFIAQIVDIPAAKSPEPVVEPVKPPPQPVVRPRPTVAPKVVAIAPRPAPPLTPTIPEPLPTEPQQPKFDMLAMINARRERREAAEESYVSRERSRTPSPGSPDAVTAAINRNLATLNNSVNEDGTGGVFQILSKGTRTAEFAFNGFRPDTQRRWREVIEVDAGQGGDVERAIVRRMIELIRSHYSGDFIWRSHRLGKSVTMSARPSDQPELEEFLMREFFDSPTIAQRHH